MDTDELDNLAAALRAAFQHEFYDTVTPWEKIGEYYKKPWREVAREAHRWLVG